MKTYRILLFPFLFFLLPGFGVAQTPPAPERPVVLVIHGGAGTLKPQHMTPEKEKLYREALDHALQEGQKMLLDGQSSVDVVEAVVRVLEDCVLFNAGRGAVYNHIGEHELDAAIMNGADRQAGAVAGVRSIRNPVSLARLVMDSTEHVLLSGPGADEFGSKMKLPMADSAWFASELRFKQWQRAKEREEILLDHDGRQGMLPFDPIFPEKYGTVGAVALDQYGNVAAATSTGGLTNKKYGRVGDSPLIGAGTWADNATGAFSCTGKGEYFIRAVAAHQIAMRMQLQELSIQDAAAFVIQQELKPVGGKGGVIGVDTQGNITMEFNTRGMYRGYVRNDEKPAVFIYAEEDE